MPDRDEHGVIDLRLLDEASTALLGYFVHTWYRHYLAVITTSLRRLFENGLIESLTRPTEQGKHALFDFGALSIEKLTYIIGIYVYIMSCHKGANYRLMHRNDGKQVMYLRGYDYEGAVSDSSGAALGFSSLHTTAFGETLREALGLDATFFRVLSPKDVYWETVDAQRYFSGDYGGMIQLINHRPGSIYLNGLCWQEGVADLLDRMDHYVVYVSSITESVLWELEQLETEERRTRVTVVFDEKAIANKELQLGLQDSMQDEFGERLIWSKQGPPPAQTVAELRAQLSEKFLVTTPDEFREQADWHRERIAEGSAPLKPGERETWIDFRFSPALDADKLDELRGFSADVQAWIDAATRDGIECLPLFLNQVQLRIYSTLLMAEHDQTGLALAAYAGVMRAALDYYEPPGEKIGGLSAENEESHLEMLRDHLGMAEYAGVRLLAFGRSHEFDDFSAAAEAAWDAAFAATTATVSRFFKEMGGRLHG